MDPISCPAHRPKGLCTPREGPAGPCAVSVGPVQMWPLPEDEEALSRLRGMSSGLLYPHRTGSQGLDGVPLSRTTGKGSFTSTFLSEILGSG